MSLPELGIDWVEAKVDTGAGTSALHAVGIETSERDGEPWVKFTAFPVQRANNSGVPVECSLMDEREVRSSNGAVELRPVISTQLAAAGTIHRIEVTLTNRTRMKFQMLLGREALKHRYLVDSGRSYYGGQPPADVFEANRNQ